MRITHDPNLENGGYYAVIFTSKRRSSDGGGYDDIAAAMAERASKRKGFLGLESVRDNGGAGITVSYWKTQDDIAAWREDMEHQVAQKMGREKFYETFSIRVCKVERAYHFEV